MEEKQLEKLEVRIADVEPQQCRAAESLRREDPITGRLVLINPLRAARHFEVSGEAPPKIAPRDNCLFCTGRTPSTLFYFDANGKLVVEDETASIEAAEEFWKQPDKHQSRLSDHYALVGALGSLTLPLNWQSRTFFNLTPSLGSNEPGNCYVTAVHPDYHYRDLADMPMSVLDTVLASWQVLEQLAVKNGLIAVPFINGGRRPESGQSVSCFHSQTYLMTTPKLYETIRSRREANGCGVCKVLNNNDLLIRRINRILICAHPAPARNYSLIVAPEQGDGNCVARVTDLNPSDRAAFAEALRLVVQLYRQMFGEIPAYNIAVRSGDAVGHLHAEVIPKTRTNIPAGFEDATFEFSLSEMPERFAGIARGELSSGE